MSNNAYDFCFFAEDYSANVYSHLGKVTSTTSLIKTRILPRTKSDPRKFDEERSADYDNALSLQTFDPLWMLTRQWQYGRFQGNDCGTPVKATVKTTRRSIEGNVSVTPLEYEVEKVNYEMTPYVRAESAMFLKKMLINKKIGNIANELQNKFPLSKFLDEQKNAAYADSKSKALEKLKNQNNKALKKFSDFYGKRSFDGYEVYLKICSKNLGISLPTDIQNNYVKWFEKKFLPNKSGKCAWNSQKLAYEASMKQGNTEYTTDQYASGTLSWYSFDARKQGSSSGANSKKQILTYVPTPAKFACAPAQRLWEFENQKVLMGNENLAPEHIATGLVMQYISTYNNDWMITPLETETGTVLDVEEITVIDSFNKTRTIKKSAEEFDGNGPKVSPIDRWSLFGSSRPDAYEDDDYSCCKGLLFPPTVIRCEEGAAVEEVQFLRDEMANMLWGVETKINDGCGGSMDGKTLSDAVFRDVDKQRKENKNAKEVDVKYSLLIQNRVPLNWIPFIPEQLRNERDIVFRRGMMPIYYKDKDEPESVNGYKTVRSSTKLLDKNIKPFYVNEEEIGGYGIKVTKKPQRTRWFMGESYNWLGNRKIVSEYQANSGLMFDELLRKDGRVVETTRKDLANDNVDAK